MNGRASWSACSSSASSDSAASRGSKSAIIRSRSAAGSGSFAMRSGPDLGRGARLVEARQPVGDALDRLDLGVVERRQLVAVDVDLGVDRLVAANEDHQFGARVAAAGEVVGGAAHVGN